MARPILERFFEKIERIPIAGCWLWTGTIIGKSTQHKYGAFNIGRGNVLCHRFSWELHNALEIPHGMHILHRCDVPFCVNPSHLFLGTHQDNMTDMREKRRAIGHPGEANKCAKLTSDDVIIIREKRKQGVSCVKLAALYSVVPSTISRISGNRGWLKR